MFDGSHRTNRREINLAGRTSRSTRTSTLKEARQQRLARAAAKAKTNAAILLQRRWRGVRDGAAAIGLGRRGVARVLRGEFGIAAEKLSMIDETNFSRANLMSRLTSLLAFRLSSPLIPFFNDSNGHEDQIEARVCQDILKLGRILQSHYQSTEQLVTSVAAKRLVVTILILLRQSYKYDVQTSIHEKDQLARLFDYLVQFVGGENDGWSIQMFLCFRDSIMNKGTDDPMEVDGEISVREKVQRTMLKWCCRTIGRLAQQKEQRDMCQHGLALLGSIVFSADAGLGKSKASDWISGQLTELIFLLEGSTVEQQSTSPAEWSSVFVHFLSLGLSAISKTDHRATAKIGRDITTTTKILSAPSMLSSEVWLNALLDTISSREHILLEKVLAYADGSKSQSAQCHQMFTYSLPIILQYALQQQEEFAILASFAARGDDIMSWMNSSNPLDIVTNELSTAAAKAYEEESESESDDEQFQQPNHLQQIQSVGRQSRADLQTMPKIDNLYQTTLFQRKKRAIVIALPTSSCDNNRQSMFELAVIIGSGAFMQKLGDALYSSAPNDTQWSGLLLECSSASLYNKARECYSSCLAVIMTACSGLKAGRNASSPLLAKLAFHESLLNGFWAVAREKASIITKSLAATSSLSSTDIHGLTGAYETLSAYCDIFSHWNLAVDDDMFIKKYYDPDLVTTSDVCSVAQELVVTMKNILNDVYWIRPVLAADIIGGQTLTDADTSLRFQRARLMLSGTKLWNSLYERWCRLFKTVKFCDEEAWWFPQLASRGSHDNNAILHSQITSVSHDDAMDEGESSVEEDDAAIASAAANKDAGMDALATSFRDPKMARVLTCIPQALPFSRRVALFTNLIESDKAKTQDESAAFRQMMMNWDSDGDSYSGREKVTIHRDSLYSDSMNSLMPLGKKLRKKLQVTFINRHGVEEAGIDGGGVQKEFFDDLIKDAFLPAQQTSQSEEDVGNASNHSHPDFFVETSTETLQVNTSLESNEYLRHYEFLGRVLGKTMYESILVDPQFSLPFLNKVLGKQNTLDDLKNLDPEYYKHLNSLRYMSACDIASLGLTFEINISAADRLGHSTIELVSGGRDVAVTKENVIQYIHLVSHQRMNVAGSRQTAAFLHGFREIIPAPWVRLFSAQEFQKLISGDDTVKGIDVAGMMSVMRYSGGYHPSQPIIHWLWEVVDEMTPEQQRKFLRFMTSCSRQPLLGFKSLVPAPCIQQIRLREDDYGNDVSDSLAVGNIRLPSSSTCMNLLKLPKYTSKQMLKNKLLYAVEAAAGFELS